MSYWTFCILAHFCRRDKQKRNVQRGKEKKIIAGTGINAAKKFLKPIQIYSGGIENEIYFRRKKAFSNSVRP